MCLQRRTRDLCAERGQQQHGHLGGKSSRSRKRDNQDIVVERRIVSRFWCANTQTGEVCTEQAAKTRVQYVTTQQSSNRQAVRLSPSLFPSSTPLLTYKRLNCDQGGRYFYQCSFLSFSSISSPARSSSRFSVFFVSRSPCQ